MKKLLLVTLIAAQSAVAFAQKSDEPYMTKTFSAASVKNVEVETSGGSISVTGGTGEARVEVYISGNNGNISKEEIERRLAESYKLSVEMDGSTIEAKAKTKANNINWKKSLSISFKVYVPKNTGTELATSGGSIKLASLIGKQKFATSGGSLKIEDVSGNIDGATSGGSISITNSSDDINLSTSGGSIEAINCNGSINLSTSGGSLKLQDLKGHIKAGTSGGSVNGSNIEGALSANTSGGHVNLSGINGSVEASTSGGSMDVEIVKLGEYVRLSNGGGGINLTIPKGSAVDLHLAGNRVNTTTLTNFTGDVKEDMVDGKMNGGGTSINVRTGSGRINLSLQ